MRRRYKLTLIVISFLLVGLVSVFFSYSNYLDDNLNNKTLVLSNEYLSLNYLNGNLYDIPDFLNDDKIIKKVSVTNLTDNIVGFTLAIMDINIASKNIKIQVYDEDDNIVYDEYLLGTDTELVKTKEISGKKTLNYTIVITNEGEDTFFGADLLVYNEYSLEVANSFKETILRDNQFGELVSPIGTISTTNEGLLVSEDELGQTYYFRGSVDNNYVKMNNLMFRIVRINGDGSVRLVLDNTLEDNSYYLRRINKTNEYLNNMIFDNSDIKKVLDEWYNTNLLSVDNYIASSNFCYDNAFYLQNESEYFTNSYDRIYVSNAASLNCQEGIYVGKVGLLSIDEVIYAGASKDGTNNSYYLYNPSILNNWWTMSSSKVNAQSNNVNNYLITSGGGIDLEGKLNSSYGIRPVISLDKSVKVSGMGTLENPYEIVS